MTTSNAFAELKRNRQALTDKLKVELEKATTSYDDNRYWQPTVDKAGNGYAVIRFLPAPKGEEFPYVKLFTHNFQGPTGLWYIENCRSTLGKDEKDPVNVYNSELWGTGIEKNKEIVRKQKRKLNYVSNIYVIKDPDHPENEGKVFLFKYGKKIFDKINDQMFPQFEDESPVNVFDLWDGATFKLKIRNFEGYRNYDKSEFEKQAPLSDDDNKLEEIFNSEHSLKELISADKFKSYDELKTKLDKVLNLDNASSGIKKTLIDVEETKPVSPKEKAAVSIDTDDDDDADLAIFRQMANDDD